MSKNSWSATAASAEIVPSNQYRDYLLIQKTNATAVALGIGETAEAGKGVQLTNIGDTAILRGAAARNTIYAIGNGGTGTYQDGNVDYRPGPYIAP